MRDIAAWELGPTAQAPGRLSGVTRTLVCQTPPAAEPEPAEAASRMSDVANPLLPAPGSPRAVSVSSGAQGRAGHEAVLRPWLRDPACRTAGSRPHAPFGRASDAGSPHSSSISCQGPHRETQRGDNSGGSRVFPPLRCTSELRLPALPPSCSLAGSVMGGAGEIRGRESGEKPARSRSVCPPPPTPGPGSPVWPCRGRVPSRSPESRGPRRPLLLLTQP